MVAATIHQHQHSPEKTREDIPTIHQLTGTIQQVQKKRPGHILRQGGSRMYMHE
jgi:hypothetical protein